MSHTDDVEGDRPPCLPPEPPDEEMQPEPPPPPPPHNQRRVLRAKFTFAEQLRRLENGRVCFDGRGLNEVIINPYSNNVPSPDDIFRRLGDFNILSAIDLKKGYHQCRIFPPDQKKTSFRWQGKVYQWTGAPFGLAHLTHHFQALMEKVLAEHSDYCMIYVDDIFVFSQTPQQHAEHCRLILETLTKWNLKVNLEKSKFGFTTIKCLGHQVSAGGAVQVDPDKLIRLAEFQRPKTGKQMESFMGFVNFILRYIPFSHRFCAPLNQLRKLKRIGTKDWTPEVEKCYTTLKEVLLSKLVLQKPLPGIELQVAVDASQYGVGAVLFQDVPVDGKLTRRYIDMASMALAKYQINYSAPKRELLAIVFGVRRFHAYLFGQKFKMWTDHRALIYLFSNPKPSYMLQDWLAQLFEYSFTIAHTPGVENIVPDGLSRLYSPDVDAELPTKANSYYKARKAEHKSLAVADLIKYPDQELSHFIDERLAKTLPPTDIRAQLIKEAHSRGHFGQEHIFKQLFYDSSLYWPGMKRQIRDHCEACLPCLRYNIGKSGFRPLRPNNISDVMDTVAIDLAELPTSAQGYNYILVMVDLATGFTILRPLLNKQMTTVGRELLSIFALFGFPSCLQSDNGSEFVNQCVDAVKQVGLMQSKLTAPWNPRANGAAENRVKQCKAALYKSVNGDFAAWETYLPLIQLAINTKELPRTGSTPFTLMLHRTSPLYDKPNADDNPLPIAHEEILDRAERIRQIVHPELVTKAQKAQQDMASRFDSQHQPPSSKFIAGAAVMVKNNQRADKNDPPYLGPLLIFEITRAGTARLAHLDGTAYGAPAPLDQLKLVKGNFWKDLDDVYELEAILDHRQGAKGIEYLIKWKGFDSADNTWEPQENIHGEKWLAAYWQAVKAADPKALPARERFKNKRPNKIQKAAAQVVQGQRQQLRDKQQLPPPPLPPLPSLSNPPSHNLRKRKPLATKD